jgi:hypothetical protein
MAFAAAGLNCIAVGPQKLYIYSTTDVLTSATIKEDFDTTNCPGMAAGDLIILAHNTYAALDMIRITDIDAASCQYTGASVVG